MNIAIIGATGRIGGRILNEALSRGHTVTAITRHPERVAESPAVKVVEADLHDTTAAAAAMRGHDAVISAYGPGFDKTNAPDIFDIYERANVALIAAVKASSVPRLLVVGGAASLKTPEGVMHMDSPDWPPQFNKNAVKGLKALLDRLKAGEAGCDWTFLSPSTFIEEGERTGTFRLGTDYILYDETGRSNISMEDYAVAMIDELENPQHTGTRFTVGY